MTFNEKLEKQRRNLIISSIVLSIYEIVGLKIEKINILGNEVSVTNHEYITLLITTFWAYSFIRYYQYSRTSSETGHKKIKSDFFELMDKNSQTLIRKKVLERLIQIKNINPEDSPNIRTNSFTNLKKVASFKRSYHHKIYEPTTDETEVIKVEFHLYKFIIPFLKSLFNLSFITPTVTEYVLPYFLFFITVVVLLITYIF